MNSHIIYYISISLIRISLIIYLYRISNYEKHK